VPGTADALVARIQACETPEDLTLVRPEVEELGDEKVAQAYLAKKRSFKK
jgi:hypothetical protein